MAQGTNDPISMLTSDHEKVRGLFKECQSQSGQGRQQCFQQIKQELEIHTAIEEEIFYPACEPQMGDMIKEAKQEHDKVDQILMQMGSMDMGGNDFGSKLQELIQNVEHHAGEEEHEMFPKARQTMDQGQLSQLGQRMMERKQQLMSQRRAA